MQSPQNQNFHLGGGGGGMRCNPPPRKTTEGACESKTFLLNIHSSLTPALYMGVVVFHLLGDSQGV